MEVLLIYGIVLGILRCMTAALVCADVEYSINAIRAVPKTISYQQATSNCKSDGKELCSAKTMCKDGKTPYGGIIPGDHWVPVADSPNEWIQIGNSPHRSCILYSTLGSKPSWGLKNTAHNFKGNLFCCKIKLNENSVTIKPVSNRISYRQASASCQTDSKDLCTSKEICEDGKTPNSGPLSGDHWVPVKDSYNEWLQIGKSPHRPCMVHSTLGSKPSWGLKNTTHSFKGNVFCCKIKTKENSITEKAVSNRISYQQALASCKTDGKDVCSSNEICEDGQTPRGGQVSGDHWVPVKDSLNEWLQIGNSPHRPCILHSTLGSKPSWGLKNTAHGFKGKLFCCARKPIDLGILVKSVASTITYSQSVSNCKSDGKRLCTSKEICKDGKTPVSGVISGDHWVPVKDGFNEWAQIGNSPHKPCIVHSQLGSKPSWGTTTVNNHFKGYLFCCKI